MADVNGRDPRFHAELRDQARSLFGEGLTERQIADRMGKSRTTIRRYLKDAGVKSRPVGRPRADR